MCLFGNLNSLSTLKTQALCNFVSARFPFSPARFIWSQTKAVLWENNIGEENYKFIKYTSRKISFKINLFGMET